MSSACLVVALWLSVIGCGDDSGPAMPDTGPGPGDGGAVDGPVPDGGPGVECEADAECDDGVFCDGPEVCSAGRCEEGAPPDCDDGVVCTTDACDEARAACTHTAPDEDGDGHADAMCLDAGGSPAGDDCDDIDGTRFPGASEVCDGNDEDCNPSTFGFVDADGDGAASAACCNDGECGTDCNDGDATIRPGVPDGPMMNCDDVDNDCSGTPDEGCPCSAGEDRECGSDVALMRIGICRPGTQFCTDGVWTEACAGEIRPEEEICDGLDNDCDTTADEGVERTYYQDGDGDGFGLSTSTAHACSVPAGYSALPTDCDDADPATFPGATEICDGEDDDCDGTSDEGLIRTFYADADGDGFGAAAVTMMACDPPAGYVLNATDCNDASNAANPAAPEVCDTIDNDCDGTADEGLTRTFYRDTDGDGFGVTAMSMVACSAPSGFSERGGDCNDTSGAANPGAPEVCDGVDNDCDGSIDDGALRTYYADADGDGFGVATSTMTACTPPAGHSDRPGDCNDTDNGINPASAERCNGRDDNCDGAVDTGCTCTDGATRTCGPTAETGECTFGRQTCVGGTWGGCVGAVDIQPEECNGLDDDCDGTSDDGVNVTGCRADGDSDGYGAGVATTLCRDPARMTFGFCPSGYTTTTGDCNDANAAIRPTATEACNGVDDDCDGTTDEMVTVTGCYADADGDGYGAGVSTTQCRDTSRTAFGFCAVGYTTMMGDCNDGNASVRPGATESCNGTDDDCDGTTDDGVTASGCFVDADADTYGTGLGTTQCRDDARMAAGFCPTGYYNRGGDCNDSAASISPAATEACNGTDDDCDLMRDETFVCVQGSSRAGTGSYGTCATVAGVYTCASSCLAEVFTPSLPPETCNGVDDDCDGAPDDTFACVRGATGLGCTTVCGTAGTRTCSTMCTLPSACFAAGETCNDCDDDGDGAADDGFACAQGSGMGCTTACGTMGSRSCRADCSGYDACRAATDVCNGCDDDADGLADNGPGLVCVRASVRGCSTACGTFGTQACNISCTAYSTCGAASESCNYCDDDADGTISDEVALATETGMTRNTNCTLFTLTSATCADPTATLTTVAMAPDYGSIWQTEMVPLGYGPVDVYFDVEVQGSTGMAVPDGGWAVLIVEDTGSNLNSTAGTVGVPYDRQGLAMEWRFGSTRLGMEDVDTFTARRLDGTGTGTVVGMGQWGSATAACGQLCPINVDAIPPGIRGQHLLLRYIPDDPRTAATNEERLQLWETTGTTMVFEAVNPGAGFSPATPLRIGVTAESGTVRPASVMVNLRNTRTLSAGMCP